MPVVTSLFIVPSAHSSVGPDAGGNRLQFVRARDSADFPDRPSDFSCGTVTHEHAVHDVSVTTTVDPVSMRPSLTTPFDARSNARGRVNAMTMSLLLAMGHSKLGGIFLPPPDGRSLRTEWRPSEHRAGASPLPGLP